MSLLRRVGDGATDVGDWVGAGAGRVRDWMRGRRPARRRVRRRHRWCTSANGGTTDGGTHQRRPASPADATATRR